MSRADIALKGVKGKRLTYETVSRQKAEAIERTVSDFCARLSRQLQPMPWTLRIDSSNARERFDMARLRVRFRFNPGRLGAPLDKLGEFTTQAEKFLRSLSQDLKLEAKKGEWIADNFKSESFGCDAEYAGPLTDIDRDVGISVLDTVFGDDPLAAVNKSLISPVTMMEFAKIGQQVLRPDEYFEASVYRDDHAREAPPPKQITYKKTAEIRQLLEAPYVSDGSVQGVFYNLASGAEPKAFFTIRSMQSGQLVRCEYQKELYKRLHAAIAVEDAVLMVYGTTYWDRLTDSIIRIEVSDVEHAEPLSPDEFNRIFGSAPTFTGDMSTDEYIDWVRGDGD